MDDRAPCPANEKRHMNKDYKQKALDHVRSVCPELMELSFGCNLVTNGRPYEVIVSSQYEPERIGRRLNREGRIAVQVNAEPFGFPSVTQERFIDCIKDDEIIGHTPHLEHWLRTLDGLTGDYDNDGHRFQFYDPEWPEAPDATIILTYDLTKDGENQDEEFYRSYCEITGV